MKYVNVKKTIFLTKNHRIKRVEMIKKWSTVSHNWNRTNFSDKKRFTLDGSDNWMSYVQKIPKYVKNVNVKAEEQ